MRQVVKNLMVALLAFMAVAALAAGCGEKAGPPPLPQVYWGAVTVAGAPAPEGLRLVAVVDDFHTASVEVQEGRYSALTVAPPGPRYQGKRVRFYLTSSQGRAEASEQGTFQTGRTPEAIALDLAFLGLPGEGSSRTTGGSVWLPWLLGGGLVLAVALAVVGALHRLSRRRSRGRW